MTQELGDITVEMDVGKNRKASSLKIISYLVIAGIIAYAIAQNFLVVRQPYPHIQAGKYITPQGCDLRQYGEMDGISRSCLVDKYRLPYLFEDFHNVKNRGARGHFYRVGNDILKVGCSFIDNTCTVQAITPNVYYP